MFGFVHISLEVTKTFFLVRESVSEILLLLALFVDAVDHQRRCKFSVKGKGAVVRVKDNAQCSEVESPCTASISIK